MFQIYMDHNATTKPDKRVIARMINCPYGNASSVHEMGSEARVVVENARETIADFIGARPHEIYFSSGGTEANNIALLGFEFPESRIPRSIVISTTEHHSIMRAAAKLEERKIADWWEIPVSEQGLIKPDALKRLFNEVCDIDLVSVIHGNNETGTIQDLPLIRKMLDKYQKRVKNRVYFMSDCVQSFGKIPVHVDELGLDIMTASAHKIYGPKGIGFIYVRDRVPVKPITFGGHQESELRPGTENVPAIAGFGEAVKIAKGRMENDSAYLRGLGHRLLEGLLKIKGSHLNGHLTRRLPGTVNVRFDGVDAASLVLRLSMEGIMVSEGAACESGQTEPSHVLRAMGLSEKKALGGVRFSLGRENSEEEVGAVISAVSDIVNDIRSGGSGFGPALEEVSENA